MRVGFMGFGKLGLPVGYVFASKGHRVFAYDVAEEPYDYVASKEYPHKEELLAPLMENHTVTMCDSVKELVRSSDMVFVPIQTPHKEEFEGVHPLSGNLEDFDYTYLKAGMKAVAEACRELRKHINLVIISTVLPGTIEREVKPLLNEFTLLVYQPMFIAMGTVVNDTLNPEFILCGANQLGPAEALEEFYGTIHNKRVFHTDIKTAEGIKVFYNTAITSKILLANAWMQVSHKLGMDVDDVSDALAMATDRILNKRYMYGGGPDAGGCHPRDLIALGWLGEEINLQPNWFLQMARARDEQTRWTADLVIQKHDETGLPIVILGKAFKPETNLTVGSGATLLKNMLLEDGFECEQYDPHVDGRIPSLKPSVFIVATKHQAFQSMDFPKGSVVLDLFRYIRQQEGVEVIPIGGRVV